MINTIKSQTIKNKITHTTYSKDIKPLVKGKCYLRKQRERDFKPQGLWLSLDNGWEDWCKGEDFALDQDAQLKVTLKNDLNIMEIDSMEDFLRWMKAFEEENKTDPKSNMFGEFSISYPTYNPHLWSWTRKQCDGILLTDKGQWDTRMKTFMYGWDCASICLFDPKNATFSDPKIWLTETTECDSCKGTKIINFGKMIDGFSSGVKDGSLPKPPKLMYQDRPCIKCCGEGTITRIVKK